MQIFIRKPSVDLFSGVVVDKDTELEYRNENVEQTVKDLTLHSVVTVKGEGYESKLETKVFLKEGDVLIFDGEGRGYIKPAESVSTIAEAIEDLTNIKDLG